MGKTLELILIILIVGFFVIWGLVLLYEKAIKLEAKVDDDLYSDRREEERALKEAYDDLRYEQRRSRHLRDLDEQYDKIKKERETREAQQNKDKKK